MLQRAMWTMAMCAVLGADASASDAKVYPGMMCAPTDGNWTGTRISTGRLLNETGATKEYMCPVLRDETLEDIVDNVSRVYVVDNNTSTNFSCTLYSRWQSTNSNGGSWSATGVTAGNSSNMKTIMLTGGLGHYDISMTTTNWYYMTCSVPATGVLISYYVDENN